SEPLPSPRALNPEVPEELEKVLRKICEKKASKRYATLQEAIVALKKSVGLAADPVAAPKPPTPPPANLVETVKAVPAPVLPPSPAGAGTSSAEEAEVKRLPPRSAPSPAPSTARAQAKPLWDWVWAGLGVAAVIAALAWRFLRG